MHGLFELFFGVVLIAFVGSVLAIIGWLTWTIVIPIILFGFALHWVIGCFLVALVAGFVLYWGVIFDGSGSSMDEEQKSQKDTFETKVTPKIEKEVGSVASEYSCPPSGYI